VEWAFGKRMTPAERLRKHQRSLEKTQRELDRERVKLENQEKKLIQEIKKSAKNGQMGACKVQAKDLVRTRRYIEKFYSMRTQLQAISLRIQVCFGCYYVGDTSLTMFLGRPCGRMSR
jgi:charged multivesicular body protein 2A